MASKQMVSSRKSEAVSTALIIRPLLAHERGAGAEECVRLAEGGRPEVVLTVAPFPFLFDHVEDARGSGAGGIFEGCVKEKLLSNVFQGFNATVLAYGQTGSGKTHAMGCSSRSDAPPGLIQLTVGALFDQLPNGAVVRASFTQIYNEELQDLLTTDKETLAPLDLKMKGKSWVAPDARREVVRSLDEVNTVMKRGCASRLVGETSKNAHSSRSHAIFTLELALPLRASSGGGERPSDGKSGVTTLRPKVTFVDLAGSERTKDAGTSGAQQREGTKINLSLFNLGSVINALGNKDPYVPYRNSTLTKLLSDSLGGSAQTLMLACASPSSSDAWETMSTLHSVSRARLVDNKPSVTTSDEPALSAEEIAAQREEEIRAEMASLREQLGLAETRRLDADAALARAECAAVLDAAVGAVERKAAADEAAALRAAVAQADERRAAAEAATAAAEARADEAEAGRAAALEAQAHAEASCAEVRGALQHAHLARTESAAAVTSAEIRAKIAESAATTAEQKAAAAEAERAQAASSQPPKAADDDDEKPAPNETPAAPPAQQRRRRNTRGSTAAQPAARARTSEEPTDNREYEAPKLSKGIEVSSCFQSGVDRFNDHLSIHGRATSPSLGRANKRPLGEVDANAAAEPTAGRKRATRASARVSSATQA